MRTPCFALITAILTLTPPAFADAGSELAPKLIGTWRGASGGCHVRADFAPAAEPNVVTFSYALTDCGGVLTAREIPAFGLVAFEERGGRELFAFRSVDVDGFVDADAFGRYVGAQLEADGTLSFGFGGWAPFGDTYSTSAQAVHLSAQAP